MEVGTKRKLVDILLAEQKINATTRERLANLSNLEQESKLVAEHSIPKEDIARAYGKILNLPFVSLRQAIPLETLNLIPENAARTYKIIAYEIVKEGNAPKIVRIAIAEPGKLTDNLEETIQNMEKQKGLKIELAVTTLDDFLKVISFYKNAGTSPAPPHQTPQSNYKKIELDKIIIPYGVITKFPEDIARKYEMLVFEAPHPSLIKVAVVNPEEKRIREILEFVKNKNDIAIEEYKVTEAEFNKALRFYDPEESRPKPPPPPKPVPKPTPPVPKPVPPSPPPPPAPPVELKPMPTPLPQEPKPAPKPVEKISVQIPQSDAPQPPAPPAPKADLEPPQYKQSPQAAPPAPVPKEVIPEVKGPQATQVSVPIENDLDKFLGEDVREVADLQRIGESGNVPKIIAATVILAVKKKSSDIHIEAEEKNIRIRFRVDGLLKDIIKLPLELQPALVSRVKILSKLKIDESRIPQDGRFDCMASGHAVDLRISTLPTVHGEKIAMRILDKSAHLYTLEELGVAGRNLKVLLENMDKPYGLILSTGPTGSGKSTTLYAVLNRISNASVNIVTLEDPVEYEIGGINQCQIRPKIGFTFANGLRSILRQDPNIIMVGEIRDSETAALATQAALTGHLVLSTLHTNDAAGALPRLADLGIEPFFLTSLINAIIGQRLVRRLCPKCKRKAHIPAPILKDIEGKLEKFNLPKPYQFFEGGGCPECELGYKGRIGIFEILAMSLPLEKMILERKGANDIKNTAIAEGMITMEQDGLIKALKGVTTVNEVLRVITV